MRLLATALVFLAKSTLLTASQEMLPTSEIMTQEEMKQIGLANATPQQKKAFEQWVATWTKQVLDQASSYRSGEALSSWIRRWPSYAAPNKTVLTQEDIEARKLHNQRINKVFNDGEIIEFKDGSSWLIGPIYRYLTTKWQRDQEIEVSPSEDIRFKYTLHNKSLDEYANANMKTKASPTGEKPQETANAFRGNIPLKNVSINGDTLTLNNDSLWNIAPIDMFRVKNWKANDRILVKPSNNTQYKFRLTNLDSGETALANSQEEIK